MNRYTFWTRYDIEDPAAMSGRGAVSGPSFDRRRWFAARRTGSGQFYPDPTRPGLQSELASAVSVIGFFVSSKWLQLVAFWGENQAPSESISRYTNWSVMTAIYATTRGNRESKARGEWTTPWWGSVTRCQHLGTQRSANRATAERLNGSAGRGLASDSNTITRDITESAVVSIEAESLEQAHMEAITDTPALEWAVDEGNNNESPYLPDPSDYSVEEVKP